ncbi:unnamed protein product [Gongylonema pulchrum]|uniref:GDP-D-glucose phosphorylase 1 n=1 Tax=Gongylonema pulchrum TaxID=637853 RepID=A0A183DZL7_9BILA|nr:unnamed protein product [Gongylonema pulchrum]
MVGRGRGWLQCVRLPVLFEGSGCAAGPEALLVMMSRKIVMLGSSPRTQRSQSAIQLPVGQECTSSAPLFYYSPSDFIYDLRNVPSSQSDENRTRNAKDERLFNYDLNCMYKLLDGDFNLSVQLNVERGEMRRKPMHFRAVREPFNHLRWNFAKLKQNEIILYLRRKDGFPSSDPLDRHVVAINAAPLERGHSLLLPSINRCSPQVLSEVAVRLATDVMLLTNNESFHVLFNSLLGQASINHLHLHMLTWPYDSDLINRKCEHLYDNIYVMKRPVWYAHALVSQLPSPDHYETFVK